MTSNSYLCRCACGLPFVSVYPTTVRCQVCWASVINAIEDKRDEDSQDDGGDAYDGFDSPAIDSIRAAAPRFFWANSLECVSRKTGRWETVLKIVAITLVLMGLGYVLSMAQADAQGWGQ